MSKLKKELAEEAIDELNQIIKSRHDQVINNYIKIKILYKKEYGLPELDVIRHEVCLCLIFHLNQAAIALTNHLLESFLKYSLIFLDYKKQSRARKGESILSKVDIFEESKEIYGYKLNTCINKARKEGVISNTEKKLLHDFRIKFRNPFSHADKGKMFADKEIPLQTVQLENGDFKFGSAEIEKITNLPFTHGPIQYHYAEQNAMPYFVYLDEIIRKTMGKVFS